MLYYAVGFLMRYDWLVPLAGAALNLLLGLFVWARNVRLSNAYLALALGFTVWDLDLFALFYATDAESAAWWSMLLRAGPIITLSLGFRLSLLVCGMTGTWTKVALWISTAWTGLLLF